MIELSNVSKTFIKPNGGFLNVIDNISFKIKDNELYCILGPTGCGKSTIINLIAGFMFPDTGKISVNDEEIRGPGPSRAVVFQDHTLFPWKTVSGNLEFGLKCLSEKKEDRLKKTEKLLKLIELENFHDTYPHKLSGGMKQLVAFARAMAIEPEIIMMDEPFAALDEFTRVNFQEKLLNLHHLKPRTILLATHNIEEALFLADKIIVLSERPAKVIKIINVPFPKNRKSDLRNSIQFLELKKQIYTHLQRPKA